MRRLATDMGGNTFCVSTEGRGSTFGVQLPLWTKSNMTTRQQDDEKYVEPGKATFERLLAEIEEKSETEIALPG